MKRVLALLFVAVVLALGVLPLTASGAEMTETKYIYFETPTGSVAWNNFKMVYCHMWSKSGGDIYAWQAKEETAEDMGNGFWRYDLSGIDFDPEGEYSLIFSNENGMQTYNLNITSACLGDIVTCNGDTCVNPVDGEKSCAVARWKYNGEKVHPAIEVDSAGKLLNVDNVALDGIETVWGDSQGESHELPEAAVTLTATEGETLSAADIKAEKDDGINLRAATTWIIVASAVVVCALVAVAIILARKNRK